MAIEYTMATKEGLQSTAPLPYNFPSFSITGNSPGIVSKCEINNSVGFPDPFSAITFPTLSKVTLKL